MIVCKVDEAYFRPIKTALTSQQMREDVVRLRMTITRALAELERVERGEAQLADVRKILETA